MTPVIVAPGSSPVILAMPHGGAHLPEPALHGLNQIGLSLADTDWHIDRLYDGLLPDATLVNATFHRYLIDANRDPDPEAGSLYPGRNTTGLCPLTDFDGRPIHKPGEEPSEKDAMARVRAFHRPYHAALAAEIARVKALHGVAIVYDCHSIRSHIPFLFEGELPALNIGTNGGVTCAPDIEKAVLEIAAASGFSHVLNGRFRGGWTTRHYGRPETGVHAIQMEIAQSAYMDEAPPWTYRADRAERLRAVLKEILEKLAGLNPLPLNSPGTRHDQSPPQYP
jgi:N-formylglutamate deformylase